MMIDSGTKKALIVSGIVFLIALGMYGGLRWRTDILNEIVIATEHKLLELRQESAGSQAYENILQQIEGEQRVIEKFFLSEDDIPDFISLLEDEARSINVLSEVKSVQVQGEGDEVIAIELSVEGTWERINHYTSLLEHLPYRMDIEETSLVRGFEEGVWRASYTLTSPLVNESL